MLLERVVVEMLVAVREVRAGDPRRRPFAREVVLDPDLALLGTEAARDPVELGVAPDPSMVGGEVPGLSREVLDRDELELRSLLEEELLRGVRVGPQVGGRR